MTALYIGIAGGLGSMSRFLMGTWVAQIFGDKSAMPLHTLTVNVLGSLLMGILVGILSTRGEVDSRLRMIIGIGFLGGFTTYSSFALETVAFLEERSWQHATWYMALTFAGAGFACFAGLMVGRRL